VTDTAQQPAHAPSSTRLVIGASSVGTVFEWYDFFIYGTLAASGIIGRTFFPAENETLQMLLAWAGFAVGFLFRPLGAILFGYMGDRLGRKTTFLVTITLMGVATAAVGLVPSAASIGLAAPALVILLRILQGLALGGEYGGAAVYVAEHSPPGKAGSYTGFVQASVSAGFVLSLAVVLVTRGAMPEGAWDDWGWRVPFLLSLFLLAISLWMRVKLSESPVFRAMKEEGRTAANPFRESFTYPGNLRRILVALFGLAAGLTVIWYTAMFGSLSFLVGPMGMEQTKAQLLVGGGALAGLFWFVFFGRLSDRIGRRRPVIVGYALTLILLFPLFWIMGAAASAGDGAANAAIILFVLVTLGALSGATFGPVAALLAELFPPQIRYSSMSIPYHFGTGYFGGFLPLVSSWIVAETGDPYAGLWYTWAVVAMALVVSFLWLPETARLDEGREPR
jgi:MFS family permease